MPRDLIIPLSSIPKQDHWDPGWGSDKSYFVRPLDPLGNMQVMGGVLINCESKKICEQNQSNIIAFGRVILIRR
jgi:hypothetical protein